MYRAKPSWSAEEALWARGFRRIAGLDEAGRGSWAGPVVAAAVVLPVPDADPPSFLAGLRDSKQLTPKRREELCAVLTTWAVCLAVGWAEPREIDAIGIVPATRLAMQRALACLSAAPDALLLDYMRLPEVPLPQESIVHGDALSFSIAAASIIAKVTRDRMMRELEGSLPGYGFAHHKGYGTPEHQAALCRLGVSILHRRTFAPVAELLALARWQLAVPSEVTE